MEKKRFSFKALQALILLCLLSAGASGQNFPELWKSEFDFEPMRMRWNSDMSLLLGADDKNMQGLDGSTGQSLWSYKFKDKLGIKTVDKIVFNSHAGVVLLYDTDEKNPQPSIFIDARTGNELWRTTKYQGVDFTDSYHLMAAVQDRYNAATGSFIAFDPGSKLVECVEARTGKVRWSKDYYSVMDMSFMNFGDTEIEDDYFVIGAMGGDSYVLKAQDGSEITSSPARQVPARQRFIYATFDYTPDGSKKVVVSYKNVLGGAAMGKKREMKVACFEVATGKKLWEQTVEGRIVSTLARRSEDIMDVRAITNNRACLIYEGITMLNLDNGSIVFQEEFDNSDVSVGLKAKQELFISAWPYVDGTSCYIVDLKKSHTIKKYDINTGAVLWQSAPIDQNFRVPRIERVGNVLLAQIGGLINVRSYMSTGNGDVYKSEWRFDKPFGLQAYDAGTGKLLWSSEQRAADWGDAFKGRITNLICLGENVLVCSDENMLCINAQTGALVSKVPFAPLKLGKPFHARSEESLGLFYVICEKGIVGFDGKTGAMRYATALPGKFDQYVDERWAENNYFVELNEDGHFAGFDLATGKIKGVCAVKDWYRTSSGEYILAFTSKTKCVKYRVN
jgi:outer membrane protein assembly factor BamB